MKVKFHSIVLYILLVILPTIGIGATFYSYHSYKMKQENKQIAHTVLFLYRDYLDHHLGEAISALEMLSKVVGTETGNINGMKEIVHDTDGNDARFSGLYYATPEGIITIASEGDRPPVNVSDRKYIQNALQTKKTTVSSAITDRVLGHQAIMIASPIFNKQKELSGLLLASLRFDYISSSLNAIKPQYHFEVTDKYGVVFLNDDNNETSDAHSNMLTTPLQRLDWKVSVSPLPIHQKTLNQWVAVECIATLFLMSILFLLAQYMLLKRQTKLERQQNELQKIELVGTFAASTAHEIRNPLTGIKGLVALLKEKYKDEQDQFYFSIIEQEIERINEIVSEFLILGKPTAIIEQTYDVRTILNEVALIIQSEANLHNIVFHLHLPDHPVHIRCSKDHMKQVVLNITKNAIEAMTSGDTLTISVTNNATHAQLQIIDTGKGIPKHIQKHLFHPFFTNKDTGTGLGLVICKRIVEMYNGHIFINSIENEGTTVHIEIPLHIV
ncbi:histidine kinase [Bacillus anthracis]|nr:histidine kinase [Bacillus anthracis]